MRILLPQQEHALNAQLVELVLEDDPEPGMVDVLLAR